MLTERHEGRFVFCNCLWVVVVMEWDIQFFNPTKIPLQDANISISNDDQMSMPDWTRKVLDIKNL